MWNIDRIIGIAGLVLAIPGTIALFYGDHITIGILVITLAVILIIFWYTVNRQSFTIIEIEKIITLHDTQGNNATLTRHQKTRANHKGLTEFWCSRSISADGAIKNILINGEVPFRIAKDSGNIQVCMRFNKPKQAGERFDFVLTYELENAFTNSTEGIVHVVETETKYLRLVAELPAGRAVTAAGTILRFGGNPYEELTPPNISGQRIVAEIKRPRLGADYCLEWDW